MASAPSHFTAQLAEFWKDDFAPLEAAGRAVHLALRADEAAPDADLFRKITASVATTAHCYYFGAGTGSSDQQQPAQQQLLLPQPPRLTHVKSVPFPDFLSQQIASVRATLFMGLFTPASLAWMSIDDKLFLWPYRQSSGGSVCSFTVPSGQSIVSVGMVRPQKGVFKPFVEYCLIVTTPDEVILCVLANTNSSTSGSTSESTPSYRLVPTSFTLPTDSVRMLSIAGTTCGRIFLGGEDGCLYEMVYESNSSATEGDDENDAQYSLEERLNQFYDDGKVLPEVITEDTGGFSSLGKRAWSAVVGVGSDGGNRPRKCRKLNRTSNASSLLNLVVPDFLIKGASFLFGGKTSTGGGKIIQIVVDQDRGCLYTLSEKGWICSFALHSKAEMYVAAIMDGARTARLYLEAVARGQIVAPAGHSPTIGSITFPGGATSAQTGVGGMEGARTILKIAEGRRKVSNGGSTVPDSILKPVSIHVVPPSESSRLTLVAVTSGGLRMYISSLTPNIISSGPAANIYGSNRNPLSPHSRLTLCHIRAPPPSEGDRTQDLADTGIVGGLLPRMSGSLSSSFGTPRVTASLYADGMYVAAIRVSSGTSQSATTGNVILATFPDAAARMSDAPDQGADEKTKPQLVVPTGISEAVSMPMVEAYGSSRREGEATLPGGLVWDIAVVSEKENAIVSMTLNSQTPADLDLSIGLPPAYFPPSKLEARDPKRRPGSTIRTAGGAIVPYSSQQSTSAMKLLGNAFVNIMLSRPLRYGLPSQSHSQAYFVLDRYLGADYRVSQRTGENGFSLTAADTRGTSARSHFKSVKHSKAARLRPWLLRPPTVPLNSFATQHVLGRKEVVALNAGGLHFFEVNSILNSLAEALLTAGGNVGEDSTITGFFTSYGYKEGCCMCLALAIGYTETSGNVSSSSHLREQAISAALARAYVPRLKIKEDTTPESTSGIRDSPTPDDNLIPNGYEFKPSSLYEGLVSLVSRIVRPVWYKPVAVVTEGRMVRKHWSSAALSTPAKVEILLKEEALQAVRLPVLRLLKLVRSVFDRAVKSVPGITDQGDSMMDIDEDRSQMYTVTRGLQYRNHLRNDRDSTANQLTATEAENIAHLIEEKNIHSLYRLLARTAQVLNMLSLLQRARDFPELNEVDWGLLHGLTTSQLVQTSSGQDRLETLLNALVTASASDDKSLTIPSAEADKLADLFSEQCYLFYSPGSRFAYLGLRLAGEALRLAPSSPHRRQLVNQAADHLRRAARHWFSAPLITGRLLHTNGHEKYEDIAIGAAHYGSPLAKAANLLVELEDVASVVDICLITASNFQKYRPGTDRNTDVVATLQPNDLRWEQHLYHKRREPAGNGNSAQGRNSSSSPQIVAYGADVTSKDAVDTCYGIIFYHLTILLTSNHPMAINMVSACAAAHDPKFLEAFFSHLLEANFTDTLLLITSPALEKWLKEYHGADLLWRYYNVQGRHSEAGQVVWDWACDLTKEMPLDQRIEFLSRAANSFKAAIEDGHYTSNLSREELVQKEKEVCESLDIARLQSRILRQVDSMTPNVLSEITEDQYKQLRSSLVPVAELYNEFAAALCLFDTCLSILHTCRHYDLREIERVWKNVVCEELLPCGARSELGFSFMQKFVADVEKTDEVRFLPVGKEAGDLQVFETGYWIKRLESRLVILGKELYGTGADYVFPVNHLLSWLNELSKAAPRLVSSGWPLITLASAGVPYLIVLETFENLMIQETHNFIGREDSKHYLTGVDAILELLNKWVLGARSFGGVAHQELARAVTSGRLLPRFDVMKTRLELLPEGSDLLRDLQSIQESILAIV